MRAVIYSSILPALVGLDAIARSSGFEPVAVITPRPKTGSEARAERAADILHGTPADLDVLYAHELASVESLTRACAPDVGLCTGYPWKLPPEVLSIPRLGVVNGHPSRLPRHRGPYPFAWAIREGDEELGMTYHLMDAEYDTGPILAQGTRPMPEDTSLEGLVPTLQEMTAELLPHALRRLVAGEDGEPQPGRGGTWAPAFGDDYVELDLKRPAAMVDRQVRAWQWMFSETVTGPLTTIDGRRVRVLATRLDDPGDENAARLEAADGPVWVVQHVPA